LSIRTFFHNHDALLTYIGLTIVLFTYIAKDSISDELKYFSEGKEKAVLRDNNADATNRAISMLIHVEEKLLKQFPKRTLSDIELRLRADGRDLQLTMSKAAGDQIFAKALHREDDKAKAQALLDHAIGVDGLLDCVDRKTQKTPKGVTLDAIEKRIIEIRKQTTDLQGEMVKSADEQIEGLSWRSRLSLHFGWFLYAIGWGLGLMAQIFGGSKAASASPIGVPA
jgi:hypothetical protein